MPTRKNTGLTLIEALVTLAVIGVLLALCLPATTGTVCPTPRGVHLMMQMRNLCFATQLMATEGETNTSLGWPGDRDGSYSNWVASIVPAYLPAADFYRIVSPPGVGTHGKGMPKMDDTGILVYAVKEESPGNTVFLSTANFTNSPAGGVYNSSVSLKFTKGVFVVIHKNGEGVILKPEQAGDANVIGAYAPLCR